MSLAKLIEKIKKENQTESFDPEPDEIDALCQAAELMREALVKVSDYPNYILCIVETEKALSKADEICKGVE